MDGASPTMENERKRKRLTNACIRCRSRKVKCDDRLPHCTNCIKAGVHCVTQDPRQPHLPAERREAQSGVAHQQPSKASPSTSQTLSSRPQEVTNWAALTPATSISSRTERAPPAQDHHSPTGPLPALPRFTHGNSLFVLTQWLDLAFARLGTSQHFSDYYLRKTRRIPRTPFTADQLLGQMSDTTLKLDAFARESRPMESSIFPIMALDHLDLLQGGPAHGDQPTATIIAIQRLLSAVSTFYYTTTTEHQILEAVNYALSKLGAMMLEASASSVNALLLLAIVLRGIDQIEMAWHILAPAVSLALSLGLHRRSMSSSNASAARTWWSLYILDKALCIELERPSYINDDDCNQETPEDATEQWSLLSPKLFMAAIRLSRIQSLASERLNQCRAAEEKSAANVEHIIRTKMQLAGELDTMLTEWFEQIPFELRPSEYLYCDPNLLPGVAFIALQYHQTLFLLHRNSLIINLRTIQSEVDRYFATEPYRFRLRNAHNICCSATRSMVNILSHLQENNAASILDSTHAPLLAVFGLAIQIIRHPAASAVKADLELQSTAISIVRNAQKKREQAGIADLEESAIASQLLHKLHKLVASSLERADSTKASEEAASGVSLRNEASMRSSIMSSSESPSAAGDWGYGSGVPLSTTTGMGLESGTTNLPSWPPANGLNTEVFGGGFDNMDLDWDALAIAFDLPPNGG